MSPRRRSGGAYQTLERAREALARARASAKTDPWRLAELQLRHDEALARALDAADDGDVQAAAPGPRGPVEPFPLYWVDESGRSRRGGDGAC